MKLKELAVKFETDLNSLYPEDEAQALFQLTLHHLLGLSRADYLLKKEQDISVDDLSKFESILKELQTGKPIQYIFGEAHFYGLTFKVNESVLIPRPETEELVEWIISTCSLNQKSELINILDIGTGSGCIAIALKKNLPNTAVVALDIAADSLGIAKQNAQLNNVEVQFIEDDILNAQLSTFSSQFSIIVSNPPYITAHEKAEMHANVLAHEPHRALFVSNEKPLIFYDAITNFALKNLQQNALLFFEINEYLGQQTVQLLKDKGFKDIELRKDMQGKERMIKASL
ncbi:peptide chain release factor N(5)-glutamine methyltransferase [Pedobacter boryungensis]|uniref:peptide chain release factor N(5)-glutamine methyltransferase n=1 Tax=Pedobacter boryungensis TaxID=869962 RepID=A0ABX2D9W3_9SPHI|nr:peptide chain release factor N(5)-glutamine methyltransferase [Pedobacter boryungensis]NQX30824.1 peptide chain release factor N(5)-glutamine methyltransferase [Pedobacter boryungensis]